jgi:hypothetical protein
MKKHAKLLLLPLFVLGIFAMVLIFNGCKKAAPAYSCSDGVDDGCGDKWTACCNTVQCYYSYKGKKYYCKSTTDCNDAAFELIADIDCTAGVNLNTLTTGNTVCELLEVVEMLREANDECIE